MYPQPAAPWVTNMHPFVKSDAAAVLYHFANDKYLFFIKGHM